MTRFKSLFIFVVAIICLGCPSAVIKDTKPQIAFIPQPKSVEVGNGIVTIDEGAYLVAGEQFSDVASFITEEFGLSTNIELKGTSLPVKISYLASLEDEGYRLTVSQNEVAILAKTQAGAFYGYQTLKQLFPADFFKAKNLVNEMELPCVNVVDAPRFKYRGLHLDSARHFHSVTNVKRFIDIMALHKFNKFHWHLTDDQGWRLEIKKYPKLTSVGAYRKETLKGLYRKSKEFDNRPHGGFYSQADAKEIIEYAAKRFITVIPEIDLPGHTKAAIAAYPELGNSGQPVEVHTTWGVVPQVINVSDSTINFFKDVFDEVLSIFPSEYIHIGGDECPTIEWQNSAAAQLKMQKEGFSDERELQGWIVKQLEKHITSYGRKVIGWDEIVDVSPSKTTTIMGWRGEAYGLKAASLGYDVIMTPHQITYLDKKQSAIGEPLASSPVLPLKKLYNWDPCANIENSQQKKHIIGAQCCLWGEYIKNMEQVIYMGWPRACALSEIVWSKLEGRNFNQFEKRLKPHLVKLAFAGFDVKFIPYSTQTINCNFSSNVVTTTHPMPQSPNGLYQVYVTSNFGDEIELEGADIFYNYKLIDSEYHYGLCGKFNQGSIFTFQTGVPTTNHESEVRIRLRTKNNKPAKCKLVISTM